MAVLCSGVLLCYGVGWKCRGIVPIGTDGDDPSQRWRMVSIRVRLSVRERLRKHSLRCYGVGWKVGGSSRSGWIVTTRHCGEFASVRLPARDLENIHCVVVERSSVRSSVRERLWKYSWRFVLFMWWNSWLAQNWLRWAVMHEARSRRKLKIKGPLSQLLDE